MSNKTNKKIPKPAADNDITELLSDFLRTVKQYVAIQVSKSPIKITRLQFGIIHILKHHNSGSMTITEISKIMEVEPPTLVQSIADLEKRKLVTKARDPNDRRRMPLILTEKSLKLHETAAALIYKPMNRAFAKMKPVEKKLFSKVLNEIIQSYKQ